MKLHTPRALAPLCVSALFYIACLPASAQLVISGEDANIRFGILGQFWGSWQQDQNTTGSQGYQQNLYLRRIRLIAAGEIAKDVTFFFETDQPNLGRTPKTQDTGFFVQDAFLEWKASNVVRVDGGLMLVPFSRNVLQSPSSYYGLDISSITTVNNSVMQNTALRDLGFQLRGFFLKDRLQYRAGLFQGRRDANAHNTLRKAAYIQYNFLGKELGYAFVGTALGKQKTVALNAGVDSQGSYRAYSANLAANIPVRDGDEIGGQFQYMYYDGRSRFPTIPKQNDFLFELAYYNGRTKVQPFVKYETANFVRTADCEKEYQRWGGGVNYYIHGQRLKFTGQVQRLLPQNSLVHPSTEAAVQLQVYYF